LLIIVWNRSPGGWRIHAASFVAAGSPAGVGHLVEGPPMTATRPSSSR
jgi:hypothetical protein